MRQLDENVTEASCEELIRRRVRAFILAGHPWQEALELAEDFTIPDRPTTADRPAAQGEVVYA